MQQIHGKLNIDKVDETMYVMCWNQAIEAEILITYLGRNFGSNMHLAKKLHKLSQVHLLASLSMRQNWTTSWRSLSKNNLIIRC